MEFTLFSPRFHPIPVTNHLIQLLPTPIAVIVSSSSMNNAAKSSSENNNLEAAQETAWQLALLQHDSEEDDDNAELHEENNDETTKLSEYHAKNYFNSTMGGKDVQVLFAMAIECNTRKLPRHKDPPFSKSKVYHTEINPMQQH